VHFFGDKRKNKQTQKRSLVREYEATMKCKELQNEYNICNHRTTSMYINVVSLVLLFIIRIHYSMPPIVANLSAVELQYGKKLVQGFLRSETGKLRKENVEAGLASNIVLVKEATDWCERRLKRKRATTTLNKMSSDTPLDKASATTTTSITGQASESVPELGPREQAMMQQLKEYLKVGGDDDYTIKKILTSTYEVRDPVERTEQERPSIDSTKQPPQSETTIIQASDSIAGKQGTDKRKIAEMTTTSTPEPKAAAKAPSTDDVASRLRPSKRSKAVYSSDTDKDDYKSSSNNDDTDYDEDEVNEDDEQLADDVEEESIGETESKSETNKVFSSPPRNVIPPFQFQLQALDDVVSQTGSRSVNDREVISYKSDRISLDRLTKALAKRQGYKYAKNFSEACAVQSGWFKNHIAEEYGQWEVKFTVLLDNWMCGHPLAAVSDELKEKNSNQLDDNWRMMFAIRRQSSRTKDTNFQYLYIARSVMSQTACFGLFFDKTFHKKDTVGYLRGVEVWCQDKPTKEKPTREEVEKSKLKIVSDRHVFIRNNHYFWTIHELELMSMTPVNLYMGLSYMMNTRELHQCNVDIEDDGLVVCKKKVYTGEEVIGCIPFIEWDKSGKVISGRHKVARKY
jgi:hypothetical protein